MCDALAISAGPTSVTFYYTDPATSTSYNASMTVEVWEDCAAFDAAFLARRNLGTRPVACAIAN
jgi:hypothetical protein